MQTRQEDFEKMLSDVRAEYARICEKMDALRLDNKTKTVTYRELLGNKLLSQNILALYRRYGLIE